MESDIDSQLTKPVNQRKFRLIILVFLLVGIVILVGLTIAYVIYLRPSQVPAVVADIKPNPGVLAYKQGGTILGVGDIWIRDIKADSYYRLTNKNNIYQIYSWSPDNKYILARVLINVGGFNQSGSYTLVDASTGEENGLGIPSDSMRVTWISNNEIQYSNSFAVYKIDLEGHISLVKEIPHDVVAMDFTFSKGGDKVIYDTAFADMPSSFPIDVKEFDLNSGEVDTLSSDFRSYLAAVSGKSAFFQTDQYLLRYSFDSKAHDSLFELAGFRIVDFVVSSDESKLLYTMDNLGIGDSHQRKLFVYDLATKSAKELISLTNNGTYFANVSISRDGSYGAYGFSGVVRSASYVINLSNSDVISLCESACYYPTWQN